MGEYKHRIKASIKKPENLKALNINKNAPKVELKVEYVVGYRCNDQRNNVFFTANKKIVYNTAAMGIVLDYKQNK